MILDEVKESNVNGIAFRNELEGFIVNFNVSAVVQDKTSFQLGHELFVDLKVINLLERVTDKDMIDSEVTCSKGRCFADNHVGELTSSFEGSHVFDEELIFL